MTIGDRIKERRKKLNMTSDELADELGKSRATIYRYENGDIKNLPTTILEPLAEALYTTPAYLMGWTDDYHDWERIGNDEGIYPPKDYDGSYEDYVKYKYLESSDDLIDRYYDIYKNAMSYLKKNGCQVVESSGTNDVLIIMPNKEHLKVNINDLTYNFMVFGSSKPGIKTLITPRRIIDLRDEETQLLKSFNRLNQSGRIEAQKRIDELTMLPTYANKISGAPLSDVNYLEPVAAHERTDTEVTSDMVQTDNDIMDNSKIW
jgi:DNA-binding helix-turn-helix protein